MTELEIGKAVVRFLLDQRFEVYEEVQAHRSGRIADVVGRRGPTIVVVECKTSFGLSVLGQGMDWLDQAHWTYVATPRSSVSISRHLCAAVGLGWLVYEACDRGVVEMVRPQLNRHPYLKWTDCLNVGHQTHARAGSQAGTRYSPFRATVEALERFVKENPGASLKRAIEAIDHHYGSAATARSCVAAWMRKGIIDTVIWGPPAAGRRGRGLWLASNQSAMEIR